MTQAERERYFALNAKARAIPLAPGGFVHPEASALFAQANAIEEAAKQRQHLVSLEERLGALERQLGREN